MSSTNSSQDSLHKVPKKKGKLSSLGRFFSKKEKAKAAKEHGTSGLVSSGKYSYAWNDARISFYNKDMYSEVSNKLVIIIELPFPP